MATGIILKKKKKLEKSRRNRKKLKQKKKKRTKFLSGDRELKRFRFVLTSPRSTFSWLWPKPDYYSRRSITRNNKAFSQFLFLTDRFDSSFWNDGKLPKGRHKSSVIPWEKRGKREGKERGGHTKNLSYLWVSRQSLRAFKARKNCFLCLPLHWKFACKQNYGPDQNIKN